MTTTVRPLSMVVLGAPGLGKSTLAGSIADGIMDPSEVLLCVTKPGEEKSWMYQKTGLIESAELYHDPKWKPTLGSYTAGAYVQLLQRLQSLLDDETYGAVIVDPGTDVVSLLEHHLLAPHGVGSPGDFPDGRSFYRQLKDGAEEFLQTASVLSSSLAARPKWVIIPWHVQPAKEGEYVKQGRDRVKTESADEKSAGIEYEGSVLPMIEGAYRRKLAADVDVVIYCDVEIRKDLKSRPPKETAEYVVQVSPTSERHSKMRGTRGSTNGTIPNHMKEIVQLIREGRE